MPNPKQLEEFRIVRFGHNAVVTRQTGRVEIYTSKRKHARCNIRPSASN